MQLLEPDQIVDRYIDAWDRQDVDGLLALMDPGASYYDAFWRETCTGRDLARYFRDSFVEQPYRYELVGDLILGEGSVTFRYNAYTECNEAGRAFAYSGAEILTLRDGLIVTITDCYCDTDRGALQEAAELAVRCHGVPRYANAGLGSWTSLRFKKQLSQLMARDRPYLDPALSVSELASQLGCPEAHVVEVIIREYGSSFDEFVEQLRVRYARDLLVEISSSDVDRVIEVARQAGFNSLMAFRKAFRSEFGVSPTEYLRQYSAP